ncbi:hypothetical protein KTS45_10720 [Halomicroarcula limicola]|uniref:DUF7511 domain-containing protein n=2 Tax=Haloarcula limicola TaxID=1429915 RepID=A0A8J8C8K6_9EURY|nr:hypothetical protein [Halomicroarcula limicola]MBV0924670.1 hypothetical protein [Halomicroarcula limicola]
MSTEPDRVADDTHTSPRRPDVELSMTVVQYSDGPDRCTVYPPGLSGVARMSTWLSADRSVFVELDAMR